MVISGSYQSIMNPSQGGSRQRTAGPIDGSLRLPSSEAAPEPPQRERGSMFFKRNQPDAASKPEAEASSRATGATPLEPVELRRTVDPATLGFKTTAELEPISGLIGQERALKAIQFGAGMRSHDYNVFVLGPPASGKSTAVKQYLDRKVRGTAQLGDWVYVNNFDEANRPRAIRLTAGRARPLAKAMLAAIDELRSSLPAAFEGEDYQARRRAIEEEFRSGQEASLESLNTKAMAQNIAIVRTPTGFVMAPTHEGKIVKPEVFNTLPETMRKEVETRIEALQKELEQILESMPKSDKQRRQKLTDLNTEVASIAVRDALGQ